MNLQKSIRLLMITATMMLLSISAYGASSDIEQEARQLVASIEKYYEEQDIDRLISYIHPSYAVTYREILRQLLAIDYTPSVELDVLDVTEKAEGVLVRVTQTVEVPNTDQVMEQTMLFVLKPHNGQLKLLGEYEELSVDEYDPQTGVLTSQKGKYEVQLPEEWIPARNPYVMGIAPDALGGIAPDLESGFSLGFGQIPMRLGEDAEIAQKGLETDVAVTKKLNFEHQTISQGPVKIAGMDGYEAITELRLKKDSLQSIKRRRVYLSDYPMVYFFVCDAVGPEKWDRFASDFNTIVESLKMLPLEEGMTRQETVAAELGKGTVTGRVYTSDEFNCYIAAPEGWEMGANPNPAHLVEMQYSNGKSLARLLATKGIPDTMLVNEAFLGRLNQIKGIAQDFSESSRRDVIVQETPAIESIHSFSLEGIGTIHVKEVTVIHDNIYYLILCQCMEPDDFEVLEKDFDTIIQSFGFIQ